MSSCHFLLVGGTHPHSRAHLRTLQCLEEVERITVVEPDEATREAYSEETKVAAAVASLDDAIAGGATHAFICARNDESPAVIERCARAGLHCIAEKPLAVSADAFDGARRAIEAAGITFSVVYQSRAHPIVLRARALVEAGALGRPIAAEARMVTSQVRYRNPEHWLFRRDASGGGILSWLGCHYLDLLAFVLDDDYASVAAQLDALGGEAIDVEDVAALSLRFRSGAIATMTAGYLLALSPGGYMKGAYDTYIGIYGTKGRLWWDPVHGNTLHIESADERWAAAPRQRLTFDIAESAAYGGVYGEQFVRRFIRASFGDGAPPTDVSDGLRVLRLLDAAYRSASEGHRVGLDG